MAAKIIKGTHGDDLLHGGNGDDTIKGLSGDDTIHARGGDDVVHGGSGDDQLFGGAGDDELNGGSGDDLLRGGAGDDRLNGGSGDDQLFGGQGDDDLNGGSGDDLLRGGAGDDQLAGGSGDDELFGGSGDDALNGGSGDDLLRGGAGDDVLQGGSGDDVLSGGAGDDQLNGGSGSNTYSFSGSFGSDVITHLGSGDTIDLTSFSSITDVSDLTITQVGGDTEITVPGGGTITVEGAAPADVLPHIEVPCLMRGTMVRTPSGEKPVETLAIGDKVLTVDGVAETIRWIGRRSYARPFLSLGGKAAPIMFEPGSLGPNQPNRPLYVSPDHAMYVDNVLVPARLLENGTTIRQIKDFDVVEYFHLDFAEPQVILSNAAPSESYVDCGNRRMFENYREYAEMYGESDQTGQRKRRFYMVLSGAALQAIRRRLDGGLAEAG